VEKNDVERLKAEMEELFADLSLLPRLVGQRGGFRPSVDVFRSDDPPTIVVVVELAGLDPQDVELSVADGVLFVRGKRTRPHAGGRQYHQMEIDWGAFERRITLPEIVDSEQGKATYDRGLLTIVLPMRPPARSSVTVRIIAQSAS
jgi:HSP20 family protein